MYDASIIIPAYNAEKLLHSLLILFSTNTQPKYPT